MILEFVYAITGAILIVFAVMTMLAPMPARSTRILSGSFWMLLGITFIAGKHLPHAVTGVIVLVMVLLDATGRVGRATVAFASREEQSERANRLANRVFVPVLIVPAVTLIAAIIFRALKLDVSQGALIGLAAGGVGAMISAVLITRASVETMMHEGRRLAECMGAVVVLPQLLASLGVLFTAAGVGAVVANAIQQIVPADNLFLLVVASCAGMTVFTMLTGNSFAAFPVIASGVLVPLIVRPFGVDPALAAIVTLTAGSSGTLITPMAANFNIVPAALLEMKNPYGVMRFQLPFALTIWTMHVLLLYGAIRFMPK
jgi:uncharacterized membrane protein